MRLTYALAAATLALSACSYVGDVLSPRQEDGTEDGANSLTGDTFEEEGGSASSSESSSSTGTSSTASTSTGSTDDSSSTSLDTSDSSGVMEVTDVGGDEPTTWGETGFGDMGSFDSSSEDSGFDTTGLPDPADEAIEACQAACENMDLCTLLPPMQLQVCKADCLDAVFDYDNTWGEICVYAFTDHQACMASLSCPDLMVELSMEPFSPCADEAAIFQEACQG